MLEWRPDVFQELREKGLKTYLVCIHFTSYILFQSRFNAKSKLNMLLLPLVVEIETRVCVVIKKGRFRWFRHVKCQDDADWVKCCMTMKADGTRQASPK